MATPEQIAELRPLVNDISTPYEFENADLAAQIDAAEGNVRAAAGTVWGIKASRLAGLVDVSEGTSSRKLGSLYKQALEMATFYGGSEVSAVVETATRHSRTRAITR